MERSLTWSRDSIYDALGRYKELNNLWIAMICSAMERGFT
jgi:hypothetical protein